MSLMGFLATFGCVYKKCGEKATKPSASWMNQPFAAGMNVDYIFYLKNNY